MQTANILPIDPTVALLQLITDADDAMQVIESQTQWIQWIDSFRVALNTCMSLSDRQLAVVQYQKAVDFSLSCTFLRMHKMPWLNTPLLINPTAVSAMASLASCIIDIGWKFYHRIEHKDDSINSTILSGLVNTTLYYMDIHLELALRSWNEIDSSSSIANSTCDWIENPCKNAEYQCSQFFINIRTRFSNQMIYNRFYHLQFVNFSTLAKLYIRQGKLEEAGTYIQECRDSSLYLLNTREIHKQCELLQKEFYKKRNQMEADERKKKYETSYATDSLEHVPLIVKPKKNTKAVIIKPTPNVTTNTSTTIPDDATSQIVPNIDKAQVPTAATGKKLCPSKEKKKLRRANKNQPLNESVSSSPHPAQDILSQIEPEATPPVIDKTIPAAPTDIPQKKLTPCQIKRKIRQAEEKKANVDQTSSHSSSPASLPENEPSNSNPLDNTEKTNLASPSVMEGTKAAENPQDCPTRSDGNQPTGALKNNQPACYKNPAIKKALRLLSAFFKTHSHQAFLYGSANYSSNPNDLDILLPNIDSEESKQAVLHALLQLETMGFTITVKDTLNGTIGYKKTNPNLLIIPMQYNGIDIEFVIWEKSYAEHAQILDFRMGARYFNLNTRMMHSLDTIPALEDIEKQELNTILSNPWVSFMQDPSRIFRGIRQITNHGFHFSESCKKTIEQAFHGQKNLFLQLRSGKLKQQLDLLFSQNETSKLKNIEVLYELNLLKKLVDCVTSLSKKYNQKLVNTASTHPEYARHKEMADAFTLHADTLICYQAKYSSSSSQTRPTDGRQHASHANSNHSFFKQETKATNPQSNTNFQPQL